MRRVRLPGAIQWGNAVIADNGYAYVYGEHAPSGKGVFKHPTVLARIATDKLQNMDMNAWEYWCHASSGSLSYGQRRNIYPYPARRAEA